VGLDRAVPVDREPTLPALPFRGLAPPVAVDLGVGDSDAALLAGDDGPAVVTVVFSCCSLLLNSVASRQDAPGTPGPGQLPLLALDFTNFGSLGGN